MGIEAEEGTVLEFFGILEEPASPLEVTTWGEDGAIELEGEAEPYDWDLIFEEGPRGRQMGRSHVSKATAPIGSGMLTSPQTGVLT